MTPGRALGLGLVLAGCKASPGIPQDHRASDAPCPLSLPLSATPCDAATDCPAVAGVACLPYDDAGTVSYCNADACHVDPDCTDSGVCVCGVTAPSGTLATPNVCLAGGNCRTDSDCLPVHYCSPSSVGCGTTFSYYCHTPSDECANDADCREAQFCQYVPSAGSPAKRGRWACVNAAGCDGN